MPKSKVLLVVEGERAEPALLRRLFDVYDLNVDYEIVPYRTNIHVLYNDMFANGSDADVLSLTAVLKERERDPAMRAVLDDDYSDVLLVFDYEPHDGMFDPGHMEEMARHFNESTDEGKLFVNYPMVEACRHFKGLPDPDYLSRKIAVADVRKYKEIVGNEAACQDVRKLSKSDFDAIISMTARKSTSICGLEYDASNPDESYGRIDFARIVERQNEELKATDSLWVLGTCPLFICDYSLGLVDFS